MYKKNSQPQKPHLKIPTQQKSIPQNYFREMIHRKVKWSKMLHSLYNIYIIWNF